MPSRLIPLHQYSLDGPDDRVIAWCQANDVDPMSVVAASSALIVDEKLIAFVGFERDEAGLTRLQHDGGVQISLKVPIVVPMKSAPEDHGL